VLVTYRPRPGAPVERIQGDKKIRLSQRQAPAFVLAVVALLVAAGAATAEPSTITSKEGEAQQVLAQIARIDRSLDHAVEAYNRANIRLGEIERDQERNRFELQVARGNLRHAQAALSERIVAIYKSGEQNSTLEVLLGSRSLDDLLNRIDAVNRVSDQDAHVMQEVISFRRQVVRRERALARAHAEQARVVRARAAERSRIQHQLSERQALLGSIRSEIVKLRAAERARQAALARQVRARLPQQTAAVQSQAAQNPVGVAIASPEGAVVAPPSRYGGVVGVAMQYLGTPYVWGGASPSGFDCSGFVMYVYAQLGVSLPHSSYAQWGMGVPVSQDQLQPGDLVFFYGLGHVGIYIGGGQYIHSPHTGDVVKISSISGGYVGARRIL
jgi:peptidoglycan DL-endopeptidase CwlO